MGESSASDGVSARGKATMAWLRGEPCASSQAPDAAAMIAEAPVDGRRVVGSPGIFDLVQRWALATPAAPALLAPGREATSYAALAAQMARTVALLDSWGIGRGDRVAIVLDDGSETVPLLLALTSGACAAPLNPRLRLRELEARMAEVKPRALILASDGPEDAREAAHRVGVPVITLRRGRQGVAGAFNLDPPEGLDARFAAPEAAALILPTSGTTARPKLVPLTEANLVASARSIATWLTLSPRDRSLAVMPLFHIHGFVASVLASLAAGGSVACAEGFRPGSFLGLADQLGATWYSAVPTMHQAVIAQARRDPAAVARTRFRFIRSCSAPLAPAVMAELEAVFGVPVVEAYGMTEAAHQIACNPLPPAARKPGSVGRPAGAQIAVLRDGSLAARGTGEVVVRGETVTAGYLGLATDRLAGGWLRTGDIGRIDEDGYLFLEGREKELINRGGEKIAPREIEEVLLEHPAVAEAVAFAVPDARLGESACAAVVLRASADALPAEAAELALRNFVGARLAPWKTPDRIIVVAEIPKGPTGKLQRIGLAERLGMAGKARASAAPAATTAAKLEPMLTAMWQQSLRVDHLGRDEDFFDLGGDSLMATELALRLERLVGVRLSAAALFNAPTVARLAAVLASGTAALREPRLAAVQAGGAARPFFCVEGGSMYRALAARLGPEQPVLSLFCPNLRDLPVPYRVEDIAAYHLETMREVQKEGPYVIAGWCAAGVIAYEMAVQLRAAGEHVALLALFDAANPAAAQAPFDLIKRTKSISRAAVARGPADGPPLLAYVSRQLVRRAVGWADQIGIRPRFGDAGLIHDLALRHYRPAPYAGRTILFRRGTDLVGRYRENELGWDGLIRDLEVHVIPGDHRQIFAEPQVQLVATRLAAAIGAIDASPFFEPTHREDR